MSEISEIISYGRIENKLMYPHCNPGMEMVLVEEGHLEWAVDNVPEILNPGTFFFTLPWQAHGSLNVREPRNRISYALFALKESYKTPAATIHMPDSLGFSADEEALLSRVLISAQRHAWPASDLLKILFSELIHRLSDSTDTGRACACSLLRTVLVELVNIINQSGPATLHISVTQQRVHRFLRNLFKTLDQPWTLDEMALACGVKRTQFAKISKQFTGYSPVQYLSRIRFERACELLRSTKLPITELALDCGYSTSQYFSESFRKAARMTPSEYRLHLPELEAIMQANWSHPEHRSVSDERERARRLKKD